MRSACSRRLSPASAPTPCANTLASRSAGAPPERLLAKCVSRDVGEMVRPPCLQDPAFGSAHKPSRTLARFAASMMESATCSRAARPADVVPASTKTRTEGPGTRRLDQDAGQAEHHEE